MFNFHLQQDIFCKWISNIGFMDVTELKKKNVSFASEFILSF